MDSSATQHREMEAAMCTEAQPILLGLFTTKAIDNVD